MKNIRIITEFTLASFEIEVEKAEEKGLKLHLETYRLQSDAEGITYSILVSGIESKHAPEPEESGLDQLLEKYNKKHGSNFHAIIFSTGCFHYLEDHQTKTEHEFKGIASLINFLTH